MVELKRLQVIVALLLLICMSITACAPNNGEQGPAGIGIESIVNNGDGSLTIVLTDGSSYTSDNLTGAQGEQGLQGEAGLAGVGIESVANNGDGIFTLSFTDGSSFTTDNLTGPQGEQGVPGDWPDPPASEVLFDSDNVSIGAGEEIFRPMDLQTGDQLSVVLTAQNPSGSLTAGVEPAGPSRSPWSAFSFAFGSESVMEFDLIVPADGSYSIKLKNSTTSTQYVTVDATRYPSIVMWAEY